MQTATNKPTTADLVAAHIASGKKITQCEPAAANGANTTNSQTRASLTKTPAKTQRAVKKAIATDDAKNPDRAMTTREKANAARSETSAEDRAAARNAKRATDAKRADVKSGDITASTLAAELNITPKNLRVILRKHFTKPDSGWAFDKKTADQIRKLVNK